MGCAGGGVTLWAHLLCFVVYQNGPHTFQFGYWFFA